MNSVFIISTLAAKIKHFKHGLKATNYVMSSVSLGVEQEEEEEQGEEE